jgi:hypothetical protein
MSAPLRALASTPVSGFPFIEAKPFLYGVDGFEVLRITRAGTTASLAAIDSNDGPAAGIVDQTETHLLVLQRSALGDETLTAVAKSGVASRAVLRSTVLAKRQALLLSGDQLFYRDSADAIRGQIRRVDINTGTDTLVLPDTAGSGLVRSPTGSASQPRGQYEGTALLTCQTDAATGDCRGGQLRQIDAATGAVISLGSFASSNVGGLWSIQSAAATSGRNDGLVVVSATESSAAARVTDIYTFEPGRAGSLRRITTAIP